MKNLSLFILHLFFINSVTCYAQSSLKPYNELQRNLKLAKSDTAEINAMLKLGEHHYKQLGKKIYPKASDSITYFFETAEKEAKRIKFTEGLFKSYLALSEFHEGDPKSVNYAQKGLALYKKEGTKNNCLANWTLAEAYYYINEFEKSFEVATKGVKLSRSCNEKVLEGKMLETIAHCYIQFNDYKKSISYLNQALKIYSTTNNKNVEGIYSLAAGMYTELGEQQKALNYIYKGIALNDKIKSPTIENAHIYNYAGVTYRGIDDHANAIKYFEKAFRIANDYTDVNTENLYEVNLASQLLEINKTKQAAIYMKHIEEKYNALDKPYQYGALYVLLKGYTILKNKPKAKKYADMAVRAVADKETPNMSAVRLSAVLMKYFYFSKEYDLCRKYAMEYLPKAQKIGSKDKIMTAYKTLFRLDSINGYYLSAINNYNLANAYKDSLLNEDRNKQIAEMETKFNAGQKEKDNQLLKKQAELHKTKLSKTTLEKNISLAGTVFLIIAMGLIYRRYTINQRIRNEISLKNQMLENLLNEKEWLLKEIHHRVKNNLQVVMSLLNTQSHFLHDEAAIEAIKNSQDRIHSMSLIHKKLYQSGNVISVNMEIYIQELIEYFKVSFDTEQHITFRLNADPIELSSTQAVPLGLIVNEAIINAIKHAFPDGREGIISISLKQTDENMIALTISDNGIGVDKDLNVAQFPSLGIKLIKGFSGELNASINFINNNGLTVALEFPNIASVFVVSKGINNDQASA